MKKRIFILFSSAVIFIACNDKDNTTTSTNSDSTNTTNTSGGDQDSKEERNKQIALASMKGFENGNVDVILKDADKDAMDYGEGSMPSTKGNDSIRVGLKAWLDAVKDIKSENVTAVADGDYVMVYATWSGTWKNDFMGMKATGKSFKVNDADIFKFNDAGKIIEHRSVQSNETIGRQIGMQGPPPTPKPGN